jgi:hypothetical protein
MGLADEARQARERQFDFNTRQGNLLVEVPAGVIGAVVRTVALETYPTTAQAWYGALIQELIGTVAEGTPPNFAQAPGGSILVANAGENIPPEGTLLVCIQINGKLVTWY